MSPQSALATLCLSLGLSSAPAQPQPQLQPQPSAVAVAPFEDTMAQRALACTACHGKEGRAAADGYYPRLAGKPQGYLYKQLLNFRDGRRHYGLMNELIAPLSDAYLNELAGYFSQIQLPYPAPQTSTLPAPTLARGRDLVLHGDRRRQLPACVQCHGTQLTGVQPFIPGLLGLSRDYLNGQLGAWRNGQRQAATPDCMARIAKTLQDEDINAISHWLASQALPIGAKPAEKLPAALPLDCGGLQ
ncbi:c-type cytochrome [Roseateles koreensis]|uniref:C-type cytochrome n=1 Tax=Roseateles koreensis TaxID=2987526 RepID=A0ABT5KR77_9BURK|nr:c-type cytochrome [Roseateles koreensis]MDC8785430.1 c-type cytochrome [Roseateles koreensis]